MTRPRIVASGLIGVLVLANAPVLHACPICFQVQDGPTASSVRAAVFVLIGVTSGVLMCCGVFVARFARRASHQAVESVSPERRTI